MCMAQCGGISFARCGRTCAKHLMANIRRRARPNKTALAQREIQEPRSGKQRKFKQRCFLVCVGGIVKETGSSVVVRQSKSAFQTSMNQIEV